MDKEKKQNNEDLNLQCDIEEEKDGKTVTATDVYYKTQCKLPESDVAIPTYDSVVEAKEWVDDANKK